MTRAMNPALAWALWLAGGVAAGELGHSLWPQGAAALLPLALWVACLGRLQGSGCWALPGWHSPGDWPLAAARLVMLPMMAALPALADWCSADGWPPRLATAVHLATMLLPLLLAGRLGSAPRRTLVALLLLAGGAALLLQPGLRGLMLAALLHGLAWGLAAADPMAGDSRQPGWGNALLAALLLLALGVAIDRTGPQALVAVHAVLALAGAALLLPARRHNLLHAPAHQRQP